MEVLCIVIRLPAGSAVIVYYGRIFRAKSEVEPTVHKAGKPMNTNYGIKSEQTCCLIIKSPNKYSIVKAYVISDH
jgi:hypothetical protein